MDSSQTNSAQELLLDLIEHAHKGVHSKFEKLQNFDSYLAGKLIRRSVKLIIRDLRGSAANLIKNYCKQVPSGQTDINHLLVYSQIQQAISFYEDELKVLDSCLKEYQKYLLDSNINITLGAILFGKNREED